MSILQCTLVPPFDFPLPLHPFSFSFNLHQSSSIPSVNKDVKELTWMLAREQLREQHELTQEIGNAITSMPITEPIDEDELEADLAALEQEKLDEKMLQTGTVPQDHLQRLPAGVNGERELYFSSYSPELLDCVGGDTGKREMVPWRHENG